jgi:hypothetical protein
MSIFVHMMYASRNGYSINLTYHLVLRLIFTVGGTYHNMRWLHCFDVSG